MKANEMRIGNYVNCNEIFSVIKEIRENYTRLNYYRADVNKEHCSLVLTDNLKPIPLTEEWLLKFGFENNKSSDRYELEKLCIDLTDVFHPYGRVYFNSWAIIESKPKYIHQLQNLYFALTGEELTIK